MRTASPDTSKADHGNSPAPQSRSSGTTPAPNNHRTTTPGRMTNGTTEDGGLPTTATAHGAPSRKYLNEQITGPLLDGMKYLVKERPSDPLRALGEYLIQRSKEMDKT